MHIVLFGLVLWVAFGLFTFFTFVLAGCGTFWTGVVFMIWFFLGIMFGSSRNNKENYEEKGEQKLSDL